MRALVLAAVLTLALGFTVKDLTDKSSASPTEAWEDRAETVDASANLSETGDEMREWLLDRLDAARAN